ncbi:MAG: DNA mismatch repair endonuclease MutL [Acidobacteriia bacterium]|jgi:DNA mismatch repair protein MutL|nr:DNA mismatch repair endonuclease MutL [Terriglobia bacterium]
MSRIRILPETVANRIAAGEVVERPASVVKELVENALDADARTVRVETEAGGKRLIRVTDDGCGMSRDDALLAFERHATSKLRTAEDLLAIATLGFRGEALPSIAAVSRLVLETRTAEDAEGTRVEFAGGKLLGVKPAGTPVGTCVTVQDLFYCVPARKKFLKSDTTELGHIASLVTHYALANPDKHFELSTPTQQILHAAPVTTLAERVYQVLGRTALDELLEIPEATAPVRAAISEPEPDPGEEAATLTLRGFVSRPQVQRPNRNGIYVFVNRRLVRDRLLLHAIGEAYRNVLPAGAFPVVLLFLELPPREVDVNVHPSKIEVRFRHSQFVHDFARDAIRHALVQVKPMASFAVAARAAQAAVSASAPAPAAGGSEATAAGLAAPETFLLTTTPVPAATGRISFPPETAFAFPATVEPFAERFEQVAAAQQARAAVRAEQIADLRPLGQVAASFIVAVNGEGLWIVDQHVAHERVLFEEHLHARRAGTVAGQRLLVPLVVELTPRQQVVFQQIAEELRANGFEVEPMGPRSVAIQAAPSGVAGSDAEKLLTEILDGVEREQQAISLETLQAKIAASTACHAAIKANTPLDRAKMEWLLDALARTELPMSCPHGRPVLLRYSLREIEKAFQRS